MIDMTKKYRTVSGWPVKIISVDVKGQGDFTVEGEVLNWLVPDPSDRAKGVGGYKTSWTKDGLWRTYDLHVPCSLHLVEYTDDDELTYTL